jgi:hypothetical protein
MELPKATRVKQAYQELKEAVLQFRDKKLSQKELLSMAEKGEPLDHDLPALPISSLRMKEVEPLLGLKFMKEHASELRAQPPVSLTEPYSIFSFPKEKHMVLS